MAYVIIALIDETDDMPKYLTRTGKPWSFDVSKAMRYPTRERAEKARAIVVSPYAGPYHIVTIREIE